MDLRATRERESGRERGKESGKTIIEIRKWDTKRKARKVGGEKEKEKLSLFVKSCGFCLPLPFAEQELRLILFIGNATQLFIESKSTREEAKKGYF